MAEYASKNTQQTEEINTPTHQKGLIGEYLYKVMYNLLHNLLEENSGELIAKLMTLFYMV